MADQTSDAPISPRQLGEMTARAFQERLISDGGDAIAEGRSGVIISPTASGKSFTIAGLIDESLRRGRSRVLITHPSEDLVEQNLATFAATGVLKGRKVAVFIDKSARVYLDGKRLANRTFDADVILATNMSLNRAYDEIREDLIAFGANGGAVFCDEGHRNTAEETSTILHRVVKDGNGVGIIVTATPCRTDGLDIAEPLGTRLEDCIIGEATFEEVIAEKGMVPPRFVLGRAEIMRQVGDTIMNEIETTYEDLVAEGKSPEAAGESAFRRFFRPDADAFETACGKALLAGQTALWKDNLVTRQNDRVIARKLSIIHCDGRDHATAFADAIAQDTMPEGHPRAGLPIRTAYIDQNSIRVQEGEETEYLTGAPRTVRKRFFDMAKKGDVDAIVNVGVLREGVDIPRADYTFLNTLNSGLGTLTQRMGRTARPYTDPNTRETKVDHLVVDGGFGIENLKRDFDMIRSGEPQLARKEIAELPEAAWRSVAQMFDADPSLEQQIQAIDIEVLRREDRKAEEKIADDLEIEAITRKNNVKPEEIAVEPIEIGRGVRAFAAEHLRKTTKILDRKLCYVFDLKTMGVMTQDSSAPAFLSIVIHSNDKDNPRSFLTHSQKEAEAFGFFHGVRMNKREMDSAAARDASPSKLAICQRHVHNGYEAAPWLNKSPAAPKSDLDASGLMAAYHYAPTAYNAARATIAAKISTAIRGASNPKYIYAGGIADLPPNRKTLLAAYLKMAGQTTLLLGQADDKAAASELTRGTGVRTVVVKPKHHDAIARHAQAGTLVAVGHDSLSLAVDRMADAAPASRAAGRSR